MVGIVQPKADPWCCLHFTKYKFNVYRKKYIRSGRDSAVVGIVGKSKSLDFPTMLIFWSLVRNSVVLAVYLLFSVACFLTVHEHSSPAYSAGIGIEAWSAHAAARVAAGALEEAQPNRASWGSAPHERNRREGDHPIPFRTRKLSPSSPKVLRSKSVGG